MDNPVKYRANTCSQGSKDNEKLKELMNHRE